MGGFSSCAFQIWLRLDRPLLGPGELDRLQTALHESAPTWSSRAHVSGIGRWSVSTPIDMSAAGSLEEAVRSHLPGGSRTRPTVGLGEWTESEAEARIGGADRGVKLTLGFATSVLGPARMRLPDFVFIESTQKEVESLAPAAWIEPVFRSLCAHMQPRLATASSMGERGAQRRRYGDAGQHLAWLTCIGRPESASIDRDALARIPGLEVDEVPGGLMLRLGEAPAVRSYGRYLRMLAATEKVVGAEAIHSLLQWRSTMRDTYPTPSGGPPAPTPIRLFVARPGISVDSDGVEHVVGRRYEGVRVGQISYSRPGGILEGFEARRCEFDNVSLGAVEPRMPPVIVRNCRLERCRIRIVGLWYVQVEDCLIDGVRGSPMYPVYGPLLKHVVIKGPVDALFVNSPARLSDDPAAMARLRDYYATVDWALDIREARLARCELDGVPGRLVRRDPATQILITRDRVLRACWEELTADTLEHVSIERFLQSGMDSEVLVACPRDNRFKERLESFARLREAGIAEPD